MNIIFKMRLRSIFGFLFFAIACYPGYMTRDSYNQLAQAKSHLFEDWHPPVMAWLWSKLMVIVDGQQSLLFFHLALLWSGLYVWSMHSISKTQANRKAYLFLLMGFAPWVVNFEGVLWKDVGMAYCLLLAVGLLCARELTRTKIFIIGCLLLYAFMVRVNAVAALIPLIWYCFTRIFSNRSAKVIIITTVATILTLFLFANIFNYHMVHAKRQYNPSMVMIDDLIHLSIYADKNLLPNVDFASLKACSQKEDGFGRPVGKRICLIEKNPEYLHVDQKFFHEIKTIWFHAVTSNLQEYIKFRFNAYLFWLRSPFQEPLFRSYFGVTTKNGTGPEMENKIRAFFSFDKQDRILTFLLLAYVGVMAHIFPFLFKPYWWLGVAFLLMVATRYMKGDQEAVTLMRVLLASAMLYLLSYLPTTVAGDFRYAYWSTLAITLSAIIWMTSNITIHLSHDKENR